jgi:hypothetical protein
MGEVDEKLTGDKDFGAMGSVVQPPEVINVDAVAFEDGNGMWFAQCINYDIAAHADSFNKLFKALEKKVAANVYLNERAGRRGLEGIPPAPEKYIQAFNAEDVSFSASYKMKSLSGSKKVHIHEMKIVETV